ncbi:S41 family peptidase [Deinococcus sonorensis]|uniref:Tricorn protease homolog n=2 Tax=Deinococcus sonorensis TaxID=309891 RepID=A0AAU7U5S3_9DEIO
MSVDAPATETLLLRHPAISSQHLAFVYAGDLWIADLEGRQPRRLTAANGSTVAPAFSPDGQFLAYSSSAAGSMSVYVIPVAGGRPRRLTFHPGDDLVRGWTPDGRVLFASSRGSVSGRVQQLYTLAPDAGHPDVLPLPMAARGAITRDGRRLAYTPFGEPWWSWKRYRGGMTVPIWVLDLETLEQQRVPHENATDSFPCWLGDTLYFLSDRLGTVNVFQYDEPSGTVTPVTHHEDFDVRWLSGGPDRLVYEQGGRLHLLTPGVDHGRALHISLAADRPATQVRQVPAAEFITASGLSPTGVRAVFAARGEIFTVPASKGDVRMLTSNSAVVCRDPAWSPDGRAVAYLSDEGGEYRLVVADQLGAVQRRYPLPGPTFYHAPLWSPDGTRIALTDKALNLSVVQLDSGEVTRLDTDTYDHPERSLDPAWSPDSQWLAYTKRLPNHLRAVYLYDLARGEAHQLSDGTSDAVSARFSPDGRLLYFAASVNYGLNTGWLDMSSYERRVRRHLYVAVLRHIDPSPLAPESDEERPAPTPGGAVDPASPDGPAAPEPVRVDLDGLSQRILALPTPPGDYRRLQVAQGRLFYLERPARQDDVPEGPEHFALHCYDVKTRTSTLFLERVQDAWVSADGRKLLYASGTPTRYAIVPVEAAPTPEDGQLDLSGAVLRVDPLAEWGQMFQEAWRIHRDYFYDADMHGLDWAQVAERYRPFLAHLGHREDLNFLLAELAGELVAGHAYVGGGDVPKAVPERTGLLGADFEVEGAHYRISRIYQGLNWRPELRAPLTEPGVNVRPGEYLLAVNGRPLRSDQSVYELFAQTADRVTQLRVSPTPDDADARTVTVRPVDSEVRLRHWSWVEDNRRRVDALSAGRVAYIYMADTAKWGYDAFNRDYFSQLGKQGVVLDERFNGGGSVADYVVDLLDRPLLSYWATREGHPFASPNASIPGPKAMVINELAGSGGDALPLFFRRRGLGPVVGKRTWGGLIGIYDYPALRDGGTVTSPRLAIFSPEGAWEVENEGVAPDIEVELTPRAVADGHDPQLERAVALVLAELEGRPTPGGTRPRPARRAVDDERGQRS